MTVLAERPADAQLTGAVDPRICVHPPALSSAGREAVELARRAGLVLDEWQARVLVRSLGEREDGSWSSFEVAMIVPRQNGKSAIFEARILAGLFLFDEELIVYSAHEFKTAGEIFRRLLSLVNGTPMLKRRVKAIARSKGEEGIELAPTRACPKGQRLRIIARSTGSGRGFSGDCTILDECQHLSDAAVDALMPTMLARPNPQMWLGGSAPDKDLAPCEQITRVRNRALQGGNAADRLSYFEWSAELCGDQCGPSCTEHDDRDSPVTWAKTNPALGGRVALERVAGLHASMSVKGFNRELLSIGNYPVEGGGWTVISQEAWRAAEAVVVRDDAGNVTDPGSVPLDPVAVAIDVTPDRSAATVAIAAATAAGPVHLEVVDHLPGTGWVLERVRGLVTRWKPCAVVLDAGGPAGSLVPEFDEAEIELTVPKSREVAAATGALYDAVVKPRDADGGWSPGVRVIPHAGLSAAVAGAGKRPLGEAWAWDRRGVSVDISPLVAVTLARWGFKTQAGEDFEIEGSLMA